MISKTLEEYLKTMYVLNRQTGNIRITDIALQMNCSKASANKAVNNLKNEGMLNYESYGEINLTPEGELLAKKVLETYDIVYLFLSEVLHIDKDEAMQEAERIKLVINDNTINSLAKYVHNVLDLHSLECGYDINQERCIACVKRKQAKNKD